MTNRYWDRALSWVEGCTPVSDGCTHCWSAAATHMRQHQSNPRIKARYEGLTTAMGCFNGKVRLMWQDIEKPLKAKQRTVYSIWNDLFHPDVTQEFVHMAFKVMSMCRFRHTFLILTKRPERVLPMLREIRWLDTPLASIYLGTSVESQEYVGRLDYLRPLAEGGWHTFVSCEPLLGALDLRKYMYHNQQWQDDEGEWHEVDVPGMLQWCVVGAETGPGARPMELDWARSIRDQCQATGVPLFVKSAGKGPIPPDLQVRQLPWETR